MFKSSFLVFLRLVNPFGDHADGGSPGTSYESRMMLGDLNQRGQREPNVRKLFSLLLLALCLSGCSLWPFQGAPEIELRPGEMGDTVPDQLCVFLATVSDPGGQGQEVELSAIIDGASVTVAPPFSRAGEVAEVTVVPGEESIGQTLTLTVEARRGFSKSEAAVTVVVQDPLPDPEGLLPRAVEVRDAFIPWLEANRPELGIDGETAWTATVVRPHIVVVMYYLFFSEEWELGVARHVTIPPHDWSRIYLRRRFSEASPSLAYEISSFSAGSTPVEIPPPVAVWR